MRIHTINCEEITALHNPGWELAADQRSLGQTVLKPVIYETKLHWEDKTHDSEKLLKFKKAQNTKLK